MNTFAPQLSALTIILRSTGPVISTRRSWRSAGTGAQVQLALADRARLGQEVGQLAGVERGLALGAQREELGAARAERALQLRREVERLGRQDAGVVGRDAARTTMPGDRRRVRSWRVPEKVAAGAGRRHGDAATPHIVPEAVQQSGLPPGARTSCIAPLYYIRSGYRVDGRERNRNRRARRAHLRRGDDLQLGRACRARPAISPRWRCSGCRPP